MTGIEETTFGVRDGKEKLKDTKEYVYGKGIDDILVMIQTTPDRKKTQVKQYFYQKNQLGSIMAVTDGSGKLIEEYKYDEFGKAYTRAGKSDNGMVLKKSELGNTRLFTGREYDREIGLYYYRARYYSADLGRFISRDPIGTADNVNLYSYVGDSPVMFVDAMEREKTLLMVVDYLNVYGAYLENNPVLVGEFSGIILDQDKANFKVNPLFLDRAQWIDSTCTNLSNNCGKQISIGEKKIYLADLGNIGFGYLAGKYGYGIGYIDSGAYIVTAAGWDAGGKKDGGIQ